MKSQLIIQHVRRYKFKQKMVRTRIKIVILKNKLSKIY